jgi:hypothetical protein
MSDQPVLTKAMSSIAYYFAEPQFKALTDEIYVAIHNKSYRLAAIGIRALIEQLMISCVGDKGSIGKNIEAFFAAGHVAEADQEQFKTKLIEAGHAAMHRGYAPDLPAINTLMDLAEALIASIVIHPGAAANLKIPGKLLPAKTIE